MSGSAGLMLRSAAFTDQDTMPGRLSKEGGNASPPLEWSGVPADAAELILLCDDPDARPQSFLHWLVTGIDPASTGTAEDRLPEGGHEWPNGFGERGYGGPRPPKGDDPHHYFFRLYAVREPLRLPDRPTAADVKSAAERAELASGVLVGRFAR
jgi:Raf kinase inhibitor-like YbhB/YbcL family protein